MDKHQLLQAVHQKLINEHLTVAVAESCTGGLLGASLSQLPGSSVFFKGGVIAYDASIKVSLLGIEEETIATLGVVSEEVAQKMASQVRAICQADIGIGITGYAGPGGGTEQASMGTVCVGIDDQGELNVFRNRYHGSREAIRQSAVSDVLLLLSQ